MSRTAGSIVRGNFKAAPDIRLNGPAAGGGDLLPVGEKVKVPGRRIATPPKGYQRLSRGAGQRPVASCGGCGPLAAGIARGHSPPITTKTLGRDDEYRQKTGNPCGYRPLRRPDPAGHGPATCPAEDRPARRF